MFSEFGTSVFGFQFSGFGFRVSGFRFRISGFRFQVSGFRFRVSGFGMMGLGNLLSESGVPPLNVLFAQLSHMLRLLTAAQLQSGRVSYINILLHHALLEME